MKKTSLYPLLALSLFLGGCGPEERIWWSPDGKVAAVLCEGALYLVQPDGGLGTPLEGGATDKSVTPTTLGWLPDGSGFALCRQRKIATWDEMSKLLPPAETSKIGLLALAVPTLLEGAGKLVTPPSDADALLTSISSGDPDDFLNALLCAYQTQKEAVEKALAKLPKGGELLQKLQGGDSQFTLYEICLIRLRDRQEAGAPLSLARSSYAMSSPRVSPKQNAVAWLQMTARGQAPSIEVSSLDGGEHLSVCESAKATFDWSPDGRSIVFAVPVSGKNDSLAKLQRVEVIRGSGALMKNASAEKSPDAIPSPTELGVAILLDPPRLQSLPDGRVLFASQAATLPATGSGPAVDPRLYTVSADGKKIEAVPTAPGALPTDLSYFVVSPDGKLAAIVEGGNDAVAVADLTGGAVDVISPAHPDWRSQTMPAWRTSSELTFAALGKPDSSPSWMLWSKGGGIRTISGGWPAEATADWLDKADSQKGATPAK